MYDGDTLNVDGQSIRLALTSTPEQGQEGYAESSDFTARSCPIGSEALVDEDDGQTEGSYGRLIGVVYCGDTNLNEAILEEGHGTISTYFCDESEFSDEPWAQKNGC